MAHVGTSGDLAKRPAVAGASGQAFWQALLALIVIVAIGVGLAMVTSYVVGSNGADSSYTRIETLRGGTTLPAAAPKPVVKTQVMPGDSGATPDYPILKQQVMPGDSGATPDYPAQIKDPIRKHPGPGGP